VPSELSLPELKELAKKNNITGLSYKKKAEIIEIIETARYFTRELLRQEKKSEEPPSVGDTAGRKETDWD
jgi:hypothetical protein